MWNGMSGQPSSGAIRPETRSVEVAGRPVRLRLEGAYWAALDDVAAREGASVADLLARIDGRRGRARLAPSVRAFVVGYFRAAADRGGPASVREGAAPGPALAAALDMIGR
jgi:predicted DNA-binding ribbon-helix-helix protein